MADPVCIPTTRRRALVAGRAPRALQSAQQLVAEEADAANDQGASLPEPAEKRHPALFVPDRDERVEATQPVARAEPGDFSNPRIAAETAQAEHLPQHHDTQHAACTGAGGIKGAGRGA